MEQKPSLNGYQEKPGPNDLGSLLTSIAWRETPDLSEFPQEFSISTTIVRGMHDLLELSSTHTVSSEEALPQLRYLDPAVLKEAEELFPTLTMEDFIKRFEGKLKFVDEVWHPPIYITDFFFAIAAKLKNEPVKLEYDLSFITRDTGEMEVLGPNQGDPSSIWGVHGQRHDVLYDGYEPTHDVSKFRTALDLHTHPLPQCPTIPNDLYNLITSVSMLEGKPIPATGTVDDENFWIVIRSRRSPNFHSKKKLNTVLKYWHELDEKNPMDRLMMFARKYNLVVYCGKSGNFGTAELVRT